MEIFWVAVGIPRASISRKLEGIVTKAELIAEMTKDDLISKESARSIVHYFMEIVTDRLSAGEKVTINGFGTFLNIATGDRNRRNPKNGETVFVPGYNTISFRAGKHLKNQLSKEENK